MDYRRANRAFLYMVLSTILYVLLYAAYVYRSGNDIPIVLNNFISEMVVHMPALAMIMFCGDRISVVVPLRSIKAGSFFLTFLYVILLFPLVTFVNSLSMLFVDNTIAGISDQILSFTMWQMLLSIGLFGPFVEEFVFRGFFLQSYQRTGRIVASILLSSVLFGLIHMNFNQFAYAAVMGIMLSLLVEATGSVLTSFIAHAFFNSLEVVMMYATSDLMDDAAEYAGVLDKSAATFLMLGIYMVLAAIFTSIAVCVAIKISSIEGRSAFFTGILKNKKTWPKLVTIPLIIGIVLSIAYMIEVEFISSMIAG